MRCCVEKVSDVLYCGTKMVRLDMELGGVLNEQRKVWVNSRRDEASEGGRHCTKKFHSESLSGINLDGPFLAYGHRLQRKRRSPLLAAWVRCAMRALRNVFSKIISAHHFTGVVLADACRSRRLGFIWCLSVPVQCKVIIDRRTSPVSRPRVYSHM